MNWSFSFLALYDTINNQDINRLLSSLSIFLTQEILCWNPGQFSQLCTTCKYIKNVEMNCLSIDILIWIRAKYSWVDRSLGHCSIHYHDVMSHANVEKEEDDFTWHFLLLQRRIAILCLCVCITTMHIPFHVPNAYRVF